MAFGKTATQGPDDYKDGMVAGNAVNNITLDENKATCAQTTLGTSDDPAWWQVDLEDTYHITGIKIYNRQKHGKLTLQNSTLLAYTRFGFVFAGPVCRELDIGLTSKCLLC